MPASTATDKLFQISASCGNKHPPTNPHSLTQTQTSFCPLCIKVFLVSWNVTFQPISWLYELAWGQGACPNLTPICPVALQTLSSPVWVKCHWAVAFPVCLCNHIMSVYVWECACEDKHDTFACQYSKTKKRRFCKDSFCPHFFYLTLNNHYREG